MNCGHEAFQASALPTELTALTLNNTINYKGLMGKHTMIQEKKFSILYLVFENRSYNYTP